MTGIVNDRTAAAMRRMITASVFIIAALAFAFGFGNGWELGLKLHVPAWIAPLVAPAVDLSVVALLAAIQYLRTRGVPDRLVGPRLLLVVCGLLTFALNTAAPLWARQYGRAGFDAIPPLMLIGWSEVGPRLLTLLHGGEASGEQDSFIAAIERQNQRQTAAAEPPVSPSTNAAPFAAPTAAPEDPLTRDSAAPAAAIESGETAANSAADPAAESPAVERQKTTGESGEQRGSESGEGTADSAAAATAQTRRGSGSRTREPAVRRRLHVVTRSPSAWIADYVEEHGEEPTGKQVGEAYHKSPRWGRDQLAAYRQGRDEETKGAVGQ